MRKVFLDLVSYEDDAENALTINGGRYLDILENLVCSAVKDTPEI